MDQKLIEIIKTYVKGKKFLVVDNTNVGKASIKKMLQQTAVSKKNILTASNFDEAQELIKHHRPEWIFSCYMCSNESYEGILDLHMKVRPERLNSGFILLSENDSLEIAVRVAQSEVDKLILIPFTVTNLQQEFIKVMIPKATPTPYQVHVELAKQYFLTDPDKAYNYLQKAKALDPKPAAAFYYEGMMFLKDKSLDKARASFEHALKHQPLHFQTLSELFQILVIQKDNQKAYRIARCMLDNYPVNPELIPKLSWLSVACAEYDDVFEYHDAYKKVRNPDKEMKNYIAASLAIFGKKVIQDKFRHQKETSTELYSKALQVIDMASAICEDRPLIFAALVEALNEAGEADKVDRVLSRALEQFPESRELKILDIITSDLKAPAGESLKRAMDTIGTGLKAPELYHIVLNRAIEMKMNKSKLQEHFENACRDFPDKKSEFSEIVASYLV